MDSTLQSLSVWSTKSRHISPTLRHSWAWLKAKVHNSFFFPPGQDKALIQCLNIPCAPHYVMPIKCKSTGTPIIKGIFMNVFKRPRRAHGKIIYLFQEQVKIFKATDPVHGSKSNYYIFLHFVINLLFSLWRMRIKKHYISIIKEWESSINRTTILKAITYKQYNFTNLFSSVKLNALLWQILSSLLSMS